MSCGYTSCIGSVGDMPSEMVKCLIILYISSIVYAFVGMYLYEVIPQQYGISKSPFFCIKNLFNNEKKRKVSHKNSKLILLYPIRSNRRRPGGYQR